MVFYKTNTDEKVVQKRQVLLRELGEMILSPKWKRELVDIINKHIEYSYQDKIKRIGYRVSNIVLADLVSKFLALNNKSFNADLSRLMSRYINQGQSHADGRSGLYSGFEDVSGSVNGISESSTKSAEAENKNEDEIKLALINKGIKKKNLINKTWLFLLIMAAIAGVMIFVLVKMNKGKTAGNDGGIGAPELVE
jgi:hypothetical protein